MMFHSTQNKKNKKDKLKIKTEIQLSPVKCRNGFFFLQGNNIYHTKLILLNIILSVCGFVCVWFEFYKGIGS